MSSSPSGRGRDAGIRGPMMLVRRFFLLLPCLLPCLLLFSVASGQQVVQGDLGVWDSIFDSRRVDEVVHIPGPSWTEGPQVWDTSIIFSDTIKSRIYRWNRRAGSHIMLDDSGQAPPGDKEWMAEPGSNGIAMDPRRPNTAYVCQHGKHAVSRLNLLTRELTPLATEYKGTRLNGPNDIVLDKRGRYAYFTDPIYSYLRKDAFHDAGYLDEACSQNLGFKGIFRIRVGRPGQEPELLEGTRHHRPNGIAFSPDFSHLYVSDCCQGSHMSNCTQGDAVYTVYRVQEDGGLSFERSIRFRVEGEAGSRGCADGFKVDPRTGHIVASCPMGICIVGTGVPLEPAGGAAPGLGGFQGADFDDDGDDFEPTRQPEEDLLPPDAADADADADAALGEAGSGTVEEEVAEETYESVEADDVAEGGKEDQVGDLAEEMVAEDDEELQQQEEEYVQMEAKEEELEEEEEEEQQREEEEDVEGKEEEQRAEKEEKEEKHEEEANEEQQQDEEDKQQEDASDPYSNEELAAAAEEEEEEEEEEGHNEELEQEEQEEASGPDSSEELAAAAAVDEEVANEELEQEEQEASGPDSTENLAAADEEGVEEEEPEQLKNEEPVQEEQEASGQDSTQAASAADEDGEEEEPEQLKNEEPVQEEQEASGQDSTQAAAAAAAPAEDELQREMADDADDGQEAQEEAIRHEDASSASRGVTNERLPQQKSEAESESGRGGGGNLPSGARTAAQAHRMRTQKASARRLLMSSSGGGEAGDADDEVIGLLARLHLGHRVSNVVFGNDGFLYATGESKHGGGALMRIALRHYPTAAGGSHDELRRRRQL